MKSRSRASAPTTVKRTDPPGRLPNTQYRTREYLTEREVERLMKAAGNNRHGHRDATMILMAFRHGLRASELCSARWEQVDLVYARLHVYRLKNGMPSVHPLTSRKPSMRCVKRERSLWPPAARSMNCRTRPLGRAFKNWAGWRDVTFT